MRVKRKRVLYKLLAVFVLTGVWQLLSMWVNRAVFLPSPIETSKALFKLVQTAQFGQRVMGSAGRILLGFWLALPVGILFAALAEWKEFPGEILGMLMQIIKSIPVASFVILVLLWVHSEKLSVVISFLVVLPIIFINVRDGIRGMDAKLLEMAKVFHFSFIQKIRFLYLPQLLPSVLTACSLSVGFCIKSGVAAEVIGLPSQSVGSALYEAKLYLMTPELFAWTIAILVLGGMLEKLMLWLIFVVLGKISSGCVSKEWMKTEWKQRGAGNDG